MTSFSGSYSPDDVQFLLKPVQLAPTDLQEKERLIQSGFKHYSEMISAEPPPAAEYLEIFEHSVRQNQHRFAHDVVVLARQLALRCHKTIVLVSLARAGTPIGVLLRRTLARLRRECVHYSVSIIRDRGIDTRALDYILSRHDARELVFVDGWTGKGTIARELALSIGRYNGGLSEHLSDGLHVVADPGGFAEFAATSEDYLIPCSILNATVSGLISRTILNSECVGPEDFHACVHYREFAAIDRSRWFVDTLMEQIDGQLADDDGSTSSWAQQSQSALRKTAKNFVEDVCHHHHVRDVNCVKPGIGETTRALLRRLPRVVLIKDAKFDDVAPIVWLARNKQVRLEHCTWMPFLSTAIL